MTQILNSRAWQPRELDCNAESWLIQAFRPFRSDTETAALGDCKQHTLHHVACTCDSCMLERAVTDALRVDFLSRLNATEGGDHA